MKRRDMATLLLFLPLGASVAVPLYMLSPAWSHPMGADVAEAAALSFFALGPMVMLTGNLLDRPRLMSVGLVLYVLKILIWGFSWGGLHLVVGLPPAAVAWGIRRPARARAVSSAVG
jgi:hypothetical protein